MKQNCLHLTLSALAILMALVACVLPSQAAQPTPTIDLSAMETAAASTAQVAATQTELANPATATPLPTGKLKEEQPDGTTLVTDYDGGYQITFPEGWTVIFPEKDNITKAFDNLPEQEESISNLIETAKNADTNNMIRVFGFNLKAQQGAYTPNINISYDTNPILAAASLKDLLDATVAYYPSMGIEVTNSEVKETSSGMEIGVIEAGWVMKAPSGQQVSLQQKQIMFKSGKGVAIVTFSTVKDATVDLGADIDKLIASVTLLP